MLTFAIFPVVLFFLGACLVTGLPIALSLQNYFKNRGSRLVTCPETREAVVMTPDKKFAFWTALRGQEHSRVETCSRWPEKDDCEQECLAEIEASPENIDRLLSSWYTGKTCAICDGALSNADWQRGRLAVLNQQQELLDLRKLSLENLRAGLENMRPLCWNCHQEERVRHPYEAPALKGARPILTTVDL